MDTNTYDALIIGAGPIGGWLGKRLAENGAKVLLIEEHLEIGRPFQCAGLVTPSAMEIVEGHDSVLTPIYGAIMHSPTGISIRVGKEDTVRTWSVCRKLFDQGIVAKAQAVGARLMLDCKPISASIEGDGMSLELQRGDERIPIKTRLLVGADGAHSWVRQHFRMGRPKEMMIGFQVEATGFESEDGWLEMFTGRDIAPGLFAWAIPTGDTHRIGVWVRTTDLDQRHAVDLYTALKAHPLHGKRVAAAKEIARYCGPLPCGVVRRPWKDRTILVGDAAGLAKPTTGGGIGPGIRQIEEILPPLLEALNLDNLNTRGLEKVMKSTMKKFRKEFERGRILRDTFVTSKNDSELDEVFSVFAQDHVISLINSEGDIEKPVRLGMSLLRKVPEFRRYASRATWALLKG